MITINLLPPEFRRRERTAPRIFVTTLAGVVLVCSAIGYLGYQYFGVLRQFQDDRTAVEENLRNLQRSALYDDGLIAEAKEYEKRSATIQQISRSRVLWTMKMDQLVDIVNNDGDSERHMVWFKSLGVAAGTDKIGPRLSMKAFSQSDSFTRMANFLDDVQKNEFFRDFKGISPPGGRVVEEPAKYPAQAVEFPFDLVMKSPKEWARNTKTEKTGVPSVPPK